MLFLRHNGCFIFRELGEVVTEQQTATASTHWVIRVFGVVGLGLALLLALPALAQRQLSGFVFVAVLLAMSTFLILESFSYVRVDRDAVVVKVTRGTFRMPWVETTQIQYRGGIYALNGSTKRLVASFGMAGKGKSEAIALIRAIAAERGIPVEETATTGLTQLNTRVQ